MASRWGLTLPLPQLPLSEHEELVRRAEAVGYTDAFYFSRQFRTVHGCSPSDYRQEHRQGDG